jgi:hypothetical protein
MVAANSERRGDMKNRRFAGQLAAITAAVAGLTGVATAGTIYTPALQKGDNDYFVCRVLNTGTTPREVVIETHSGTGDAANGPFTYVVQPGQTVQQLYASAFHNVASCIVSGETSKTKTLVTFCVRPNGLDRCEATVSVP